jgi:hypothetical protein
MNRTSARIELSAGVGKSGDVAGVDSDGGPAAPEEVNRAVDTCC